MTRESSVSPLSTFCLGAVTRSRDNSAPVTVRVAFIAFTECCDTDVEAGVRANESATRRISRGEVRGERNFVDGLHGVTHYLGRA